MSKSTQQNQQTQSTEPEYDYSDEPRNVFTSIKMIFQAIADALVVSTRALARGSEGVDALARTGLIMAESNERKVAISTKGRELHEMKKLRKMYPDLDIEIDMPEK